MKHSAFIVVICLLVTLLAACARPEAHADIRFAVAQAPLNLDPRYATDAASERVNRLLYESLSDFDAASKPVPSLANWAEVAPDHYRFTLKPSRARFHNGDVLGAADVVATYQSLLTLRNSPHSAEFSNIQQIRALDENTIDFILKHADEQFPSRLIIGILPAKLIQQGHDFMHQPVGSGALRFVSWLGALKLERVADKQAITLIEVKDPTVRILKLERGEADMLADDLPPELVRYLKQQTNIHVLESSGSNFSYLGLNMQDPLLKNLHVRQAIAHAIDRQAIIRQVMVGESREAGAILPPEHYSNHGAAPLLSYDYDPALSRQLLRQAGVQLPLKLVYKTSTDAQRVRLATILQAQMAPAGINLEIRSLDWGTFFEDIKQGNFQLYGLTWVGIKTPEIYVKAFGSLNIPPKGFNRGRYVDSELDVLLDKQDWHAVTAHVQLMLPYIPLWYEGKFAALRQGLANYQVKPDGNWDGLATIIKH